MDPKAKREWLASAALCAGRTVFRIGRIYFAAQAVDVEHTQARNDDDRDDDQMRLEAQRTPLPAFLPASGSAGI